MVNHGKMPCVPSHKKCKAPKYILLTTQSMYEENLILRCFPNILLSSKEVLKMSAHKPIPRSKLQTASTYTYYDLMIYCNEVLKFKRKKTRFQI